MNAKIRRVVQLIAIAAYAGVLLSIAFDGSRTFSLACCAVAALCSYIVLFSKKN